MQVSERHPGSAMVVLLAVGMAAVLIIVAAVGVLVDTQQDQASAPAQRLVPVQQDSAATPATDLTSFAGAAPANADRLAAMQKPYDATLPAVAPGAVARVDLAVKEHDLQIAPGVRYREWTFGDTAPGPTIHVRQGQRVDVTLTNRGMMPHSIDFHAAQIAPNTAFVDVLPGKSIRFSFRASAPGAFMYHCGTLPAMDHMANGMYGAIVVDPARPLPHADRSYVLVSSEWYLSANGLSAPASLSAAKLLDQLPDWVTWNGYANQYKVHPLTADPGQVTRFYVIDAGPNLDNDFHVVGTVLKRAWIDGDVTHHLNDIQTAGVPAGGSGIFDVQIPAPGLYPFVSHSFAAVGHGEVGLLSVGGVMPKPAAPMTMSR
jgi:nitrite reductase (NO-forming)